jgi:hypothetical protein
VRTTINNVSWVPLESPSKSASCPSAIGRVLRYGGTLFCLAACDGVVRFLDTSRLSRGHSARRQYFDIPISTLVVICGPTPEWSAARGWVCFRVGWWMCYNRKAVKDTWKQELTPAEYGVTNEGSAGTDAQAEDTSARGRGDASRFCPVCSQRLESRRCKLVCNACGYYMSCADYY